MNTRLKKIGFICSAVFFAVLLSAHAVSGIAQEKSNAKTQPLDFVLPLPTIPGSIPLGAEVPVTYTVINNVSTAFLPIFTQILDAEGNPSDDVITRINIGSDGDCGVPGTLLAPHQECSIDLIIQPNLHGETSYFLDVDYQGRVPLTTEISFNTSAPFFYVSNAGNNTVTSCEEEISGGFDDCVNSGGTFSAPPAGIAIQSVNATSYAYVVNQANDTVLQCTIDSTTGLFSSCVDSGAGAVFNNPFGIAFKSSDSGLYAYIVSLNDQTVYQCLVNATSGKLLTTCTTATNVSLSAPYGLTVHTIDAEDYAYIVNTGTSSVIQCRVDLSSAQLNSCLDSGMDDVFNTPKNIAFFESNADYAYVTDPGDNLVWQCSINAISGDFSSCVNSGASSLNDPLGIAFATVNSVNYAYISNDANTTVTKCTVGTSGALSACSNMTIGNGLSDPWGVTFFTTTDSITYAYVPNFSSGTVSQCRQNAISGFLYCLDSGAGSAFTQPSEIAMQVVNGVTYAYVVNFSGLVSQCTLNTTTGKLSACGSAGGTGYSSSSDITFHTISGTLYAYISEGINRVGICPVQTNGQFGSCFDSGVGVAFSAPRGLNFQTVNSNLYLYVATPGDGSVTQCLVNTTTGLLSACTAAGSGFGSPFGITFQTVNSILYAYVPGISGTAVFQCVVNTTTGAFSDCVNTPPNFAYSITFSTVNSVLYAYVGDAINDTVYQCLINADTGGLLSCPVAFGGTDNLAIHPSSGANYAYVILEGGAGIQKCPINASTGVITVASCVDSGAGFTFTNATDIFFPGLTFGSTVLVYVTDAGSNQVFFCTLNGTTGALSTCTDSSLGAIFDEPTGISFDTVSGTIYAYVVNSGSNEISQCGVNASTGHFISCSNTADTVFSQPVGINFFTPVESSEFAYITDITTDSVIRCEFNDSSGLLEFCTDSGVGGIFDNPIDMASETANSIPYIYVTNSGSGSVSQCQVDELTGFFPDGCTTETDTFVSPWGIEFGMLGDVIHGYVADRGSSAIFKCTFNVVTGALENCVDSGATLIDEPQSIAFF